MVHPHTKFGIPTLNIIGYAPDTFFSGNKPEVKVKFTVTKKWNATLRHPRCIHKPNLGILPQIIYEICSGHDYSRIEERGQGQVHSDPKMTRDTPHAQDAPTYQIWNSYLK